MNKLIPLTGAVVLALSLSQASLAQGNGKGNDGDKGKDRGAARGPDKQAGKDADRGGGPKDRDDRGDKGPTVVVREAAPRSQGAGRGKGRGDQTIDRVVERVTTDPGQVVVLRGERNRGLIAGCPPGLAKKNNGCLPPGQERKLDRARYDYLFGRRDDQFQYRYDDGFLYRMNSQGSLLGYLPVLGGALAMGNPWPGQYGYDPVPRYQADYYRLNNPYDYRYADGAIYGVDPKTQSIGQVAALLTGQPWTVGQQMPRGYDVYNVPYDYRDQYLDSPERMYRYNDGAVYQVDPTTQLVQAIIQLLT